MRIYAYVRVDPNMGNELDCFECFNSLGYKIPGHRIIVEEVVINVSIEYREKLINLINHSLDENNTLIVKGLDCLGCNFIEVYNMICMLEQRRINLICLEFSKHVLSGDLKKFFVHIFKLISNFEMMLNNSTENTKKRSKRVGRPELLSKSKKNQVIEKFKKGQSVYSIAKEYSVSRSVIQRIVDQLSNNVN